VCNSNGKSSKSYGLDASTLAFGETTNAFNGTWRRPTNWQRQRRAHRKDARLSHCHEHKLWKRLVGDQTVERACAVLRREKARAVSASVPFLGNDDSFIWLDPHRGWAASLAVTLVCDADSDSVRLRVSVVYSHFLKNTRATNTGNVDDLLGEAPTATSAPFWSRRRVRSRFVLSDARLPDLAASFRWNRGADGCVVEAMRQWKHIHSVLKACAVCGRLFGDDADVLCSPCSARRQCARWLDDASFDSSPHVTSFSMRECVMLSHMAMHAERQQDDDNDDEDDVIADMENVE
jgi:hypothetical protein